MEEHVLTKNHGLAAFESYNNKKRMCQNVYILFMYKASTFSSQGFAIS